MAEQQHNDDLKLMRLETEGKAPAVVGRFVDERVKRGHSIKARDLYVAFLDWAKLQKIADPPSEKSFSLSMREMGFQKRRRAAGILYPGLGTLHS